MKLNQSCNLCGTTFTWDTETFQRLGLNSIPKKCPTCKDMNVYIKPEHHIVTERKLLQEWDGIFWDIKIKDAELRQAENKDIPAWRWTLTTCVPGYGDWHGVRWNGNRHVFWFIGFDKLPENRVVRIRKMRAKHKTAVDAKYRPDYEYYCVEPSNDKATHSIQVFTAFHKTTLKGLGQQIEQKFEFVGNPEILIELENWCNSSRFGCKTIIAICDPDSDIETVEGRK